MGLFFLIGCTNPQQTIDSDHSRLHVTTTTGMISDLVSQIGREHVKVSGLMGPGVDPHLYKATHGDIKKLDQADLIFYNGHFLEGKMQEIFLNIGKIKPVVAVTQNIEREKLLIENNEEDSIDPHVWFDVKLWMTAATTVKDTLIQIDPIHAEAYESNAEKYLDELELLDQYVREQLASIPKSKQVLITAHDAFGYFGNAYQFEVKGLQGLSTASEYGSRDVIELRDFIIDRQIKSIFAESSISTKSVEAVIQGAEQLGHQVKLGGNLFSDALGPSGSATSTYIGMFKHNVDTIVKGLK
jgi:manganese/zinc/iron transport system substrate-binding protein